MQFSKVELSVNGATISFLPFDRNGQKFVYRKEGVTLQAPQLGVTTKLSDATGDSYEVVSTTPRVKAAAEGCCDGDTLLGSDLLSTKLRFLATSSEADRKAVIDQHIAELQYFRDTFATRGQLYS